MQIHIIHINAVDARFFNFKSDLVTCAHMQSSISAAMRLYSSIQLCI